jgi:hypothetical protein
VLSDEDNFLMRNLPFDKPGRFWRGNLHTHSTASDGTLTPEQVCRYYREAGYDFLAITDHFMQNYGFTITDTCHYQRDDFVTLLGAELHTGVTELGLLWHILAVGLPLNFPPNLPDETGPEIAARALESGAFVAAAHPEWYGLTENDVLSLGAVDAIEVFNATSVDHNDKPAGWYMLDVLLMRGKRYFACATDDAHFKNRNDSLRGWVMVKSEVLLPEAILVALKAGQYYSSTGPQIFDVQVVPHEKVIVRCSPANAVFVTGHGSLSGKTLGSGILETEISIKHFTDSPFCRVTVRDEFGGRAWTNPIWFE